jgi:chemotaxis protein CheZ
MMSAGKVNVGRLLKELRNRCGDTVRIDDIAVVAESLFVDGRADLSSSFRKLHAELEALSHYIRKAKSEVAAIRPDELKERYLPTATNELDAIVEAAAEATNEIMDATETIEHVADQLGRNGSEVLLNATTRIYEACGFQDITGQRVTKVVNALKEIEVKVDALAAAFGDGKDMAAEATGRNSPYRKKQGMLSDEDLLHGPQNPGEGISQDEIDRLLADLD